MSSEDKELEEQLVEIGNRLVQLPSEPGELLLLLDQVENFLSRVEQSPPKSTHDTLSPLEKALVAEELLRHTDIDVRVAVAACISEVMRITAPNAPYDDTQLKDIYPLFVSSFENLSDQSSRSYSKRVLVLETLAKVKSCVVMLDLDCPGLIVEMFQHFLKSIRDYHPENVFSFMETIMTFLLEESEDIPQELLAPILAIVKKDNEEVLPIARRLGERVLGNSVVKLKPYLTQAMRSLGVSLDDYSEVVASVCEGTLGTAECNGGNAIGERLADDSHFSKASSAETLQPDESKLITAPSDEAAQVVKGVTEEACPEQVDPSPERSKPININGIAESATDRTSVVVESLKKPEPGHFANHSVNDNVARKADDSNAGKSAKSDYKPERTAKRRGRKPNSLHNSLVLLDSFHPDSKKEAEKLADLKESRSKDVREDPSVDADASPENEKETDVQRSLPNCPAEGRPKKARRPKKENLLQEVAPSADVVSKKVSEGKSDSKVKPPSRSGKKGTAVTYGDKIPTAVETTQNEGGTTNNLEAKHLKQSGKKETLLQEVAPSADVVSKKVSEGTSDSKVQPQSRSGKRATAVIYEDKIPTAVETTQNEGGTTNNLEAKPLKQPGKKETLLQEVAPSADVVSKKVSEGTSDSKVIPQSRSGKKATAITYEDKIPAVDTTQNEGGTTNNLEAKPLKQSGKKETLLQEVAPSADVVSKKVSEGTCDSKVIPQRRSGKKATAVTYEDKIPTAVETTQNEGGGTTNNLEAKPLKQSGKKVDASNDIENKSSTKKEDGKKATAVTSDDKIPTAVETTQNEGGSGTNNNPEVKHLKQSGKKVDASNDIENISLSKKKEDGKKRGRGKDTLEKGETKSSPKADVKEVLSSPNSTTKSAKHESQVEETPMTNPKRKRTSGKDQASETLEYGENLVGSKVKVWWPRDRTFYEGVVHAFDSAKKKHLVLYDDGDQEILNLRKQQWELVEGDSAADGLQATEDPSPDTTSELYKRKKTKTHSEPSAEQERMDVSPKRGGAADSNKSKGTSAKSGHKSRDDEKVDGKSKDNTSKASAKSEDDVAGKSKDRSKKSSGKSFVDAPRVVSKSKDVDGGTPKTSTKEDSLQTFVKRRSKISESGSKSSANGMGKVKSRSSKGKETEGVTTSPESTKAKSKDISRLLESETQRFGKKRQRELKHED